MSRRSDTEPCPSTTCNGGVNGALVVPPARTEIVSRPGDAVLPRICTELWLFTSS